MKYDFAIIGSGIIGLTLAFKLKQKFNNINIDISTDDKEWVEDQNIFSGAKNIFAQESAHKSGKDNNKVHNLKA